MIFAERISTIRFSEMSEYCRLMVYIFQLLAILEVVHAVTGLVRANPMTTIVQVFGRLQVLLIHHYITPSARESFGNLPMVLAWSSVEIVRYLYLGLNVVGLAPYWLLWLRYSLFYVLYPVGVYGEMKVLYDSLALLDKTQFLSIDMPNVWNISFSFANYIRFFLWVLYIPGLYSQYMYMIKQRQNVLSKVKKGE